MNSGMTPRITGWIARPLDRVPRAATFSAAYLFRYYAALAPPWRVDSRGSTPCLGGLTLSLGKADNDRREGYQGQNARRGRYRPAHLPSGRQRPLSCTICRLSLSLRQQSTALFAVVPMARDRTGRVVCRGARLRLRARGCSRVGDLRR